MSTLSLRKIKHDSSAVDNITLDSTGNTSITKRLEIQQDASSNNRIVLRGQTGSSYRYCIDNNSSLNVFRVFRENDADGSAGAEYLKLDSSGRLMIPNQPAFRALKSTSPNGTSENPIQYDVIDFNIGGNYNSSTYRFTAPIAGRYMFNVQLSFYIPGDARQVEVSILKNGTGVQASDCFMQLTQGNNTHASVSITTVLNLAANDYVQGAWVSSTASITLYSSTGRVAFSGHLVG